MKFINFYRLSNRAYYTGHINSAPMFFRSYTKYLGDEEKTFTGANSEIEYDKTNKRFFSTSKRCQDINVKEIHEYFSLFNQEKDDEAQQKLKETPQLALVKHNIIHTNKKWVFENISTLQYTWWSLDWDRWNLIKDIMLENDMKEELKTQILEHMNLDDPPLYVQKYGLHFDLNYLLDAIKEYIDKPESWSGEQAARHWCIKVKEMQDNAPKYLKQAYRESVWCDSLRFLYSAPQIDALNWYSIQNAYEDGRLDYNDAVSVSLDHLHCSDEVIATRERCEYPVRCLPDPFGGVHHERDFLACPDQKQAQDGWNFVSDIAQKRLAKKDKILKQINSSRGRTGLNTQEVDNFFELFSQGNKNEYVIKFKNNPELALAKGTIIHPNKKWIFEDISALQYSFWALDWKTLNSIKNIMLESNLEEEFKVQTLEHIDLNNPPLYVKKYGLHFNFSPLLDAIKEYSNQCSTWDDKMRAKQWCTKIRSLQENVPEYLMLDYLECNDQYLNRPDLWWKSPNVAWARAFDSLKWEHPDKEQCFDYPIIELKKKKSFYLFTDFKYYVKKDLQACPDKKLALQTWSFVSNTVKTGYEQKEQLLQDLNMSTKRYQP